MSKRHERCCKKTFFSSVATGTAIQALAILSFLAIISGCATIGKAVDERTAQSAKPQYTHQLNEPLDAAVGEPMMSSSPLLLRERANLVSSLSASTNHRSKTFNVSLSKGQMEFVAVDDAGKYYESSEQNLTVNGETYPGGVYIPYSSNEPAALYWRWNVSAKDRLPLGVYVAYLDIQPALSNHSIGAEVPPDYYSGIVSTISYLGVSGGQITFVYREYVDGKARAAFTQEFSLDYAPGIAIAYKNARFVVHSADSMRIKYTLLSTL